MFKINLPQKNEYLNSELRQCKEILQWMKRIMELDENPFLPTILLPSSPVWPVNKPKVLVTVMRAVCLFPVPFLYSSDM